MKQLRTIFEYLQGKIWSKAKIDNMDWNTSFLIIIKTNYGK
jgi:hypothetical protein